jgi:multicomponent Na+:H+ antiporter subunit A
MDQVGPEVPAPGPALWGPPAVLGVAGLLLGIVPGAADTLVAAAAPGGKLVLWPGWKPALAVSVAIIAAGVAVYAAPAALAHAQHRVAARLTALRVPTAEGSYRWLVDMLNRTADRVTGITQNGSLPVYIAVILITSLTVPAAAWIGAGGTFPQLPPLGSAAEIALGVFVAVVSIAVLRAKRRLAAVILLGAVGYAIAGVFVLFGAPDLALTLLLVETVTVAVFAFVLGRLPRRFEEQPWRIGRALRAGVALLVGGFVTAAALATNGIRTAPPVSEVYADLAPEAGGRNVVNVILTDFRALDTLGEITVIAAAAIGVGALVMRSRTHRRADEGPDTVREAA